MSTSAIARNAPCPCGSGKRFKDCHGSSRSTAGTAEAWWRALENDPDDAEASFHLGNLNLAQGEHGAALIHYQRALVSAPDNALVLNNLGLCYKAQGATDRAEECYREALAIDPAQPDALSNLANLSFNRERYAEVIALTDRLLALPQEPRPSMRLLRALAQERTGDGAGSEATLREAVRRRPDDATLHAYLGTLLARADRYADAEASLARSLALAPDSAYAVSMLAHVRQQRCAWSELAPLFARLEALLARELAPESVPVDAFSALSMPLSPLAQLHVARRWAAIQSLRRTDRPVVRVAPGERLRVAFVSANFRDHATMHLSAEFWEKVDRSRLEMFAYSLRRDDGPFQRRAQAAFEHFIDVAGDSTQRIAQRIRDDRIAILIDRSGYTVHAREGIFALRPAPIQVNCIGFPGTLGAPWYDYIFTDRFSLPEHLRRFYDERPLYMPHMALPSDTTRLPEGPPPTRAACGLPQGGFVFCCFNASYKILPAVFTVWMRLLARVPGSVLWLLQTGDEAKANLRREAAAAGIDPQRLIFAPRTSVGAHVARHAAADLFLDSYPYGAHTSANDALLAGLPVLTRAGETLVSRIAGSQLHAIGLPELVTASPEDYEALALKLATDPELLARYRRRLAENRRTMPLFDMARYARDFESLMARAWDEHANKR